MRVLVTGGAGFIGSWLVDELVNQGHEVTVLDNLEGGKQSNVNPKAEFFQGDLRIKKYCEMAVNDKPEVIFHCAAFAAEGASVFNPRYAVESNLIGFLNLFTSALNVGFETFVFFSSIAVYGKDPPISGFLEYMPRKPVDPYGITKSAVECFLELYSKEFGFNYVIFRPYNVYGERQNLADPYRNALGIWMNRIMQGRSPIIYGDGSQKRAFSYIGDSAPIMVKAAWTKQAYGEVFNIGSSEVVTIKEACRIVMDAMDYKGEPIYTPERPLEVKHTWCCTEKAKQILSYEAKTSLTEGVAKMAVWAKQQGPHSFNYWNEERKFEITKKVPDVWTLKEI